MVAGREDCKKSFICRDVLIFWDRGVGFFLIT